MGKQPFAKKRGFKRSKAHEATDEHGRGKKARHSVEEIVRSLSPTSSGDSSEEHSKEALDEELEATEIYKEPSTYDNLLKTLGSASESLANAYKRRQREEEGISDSEEDLDADSESLSVFDEDDDGDDNESPRTYSDGKLHGSSLLGDTEQTENDVTDDEEEAFDTDEEHDMKVDGHFTAKASESTSSFNEHLGYKLSKDEVDNLIKGKWKNKWKVPADDKSNCHWIGTGECFIKDDDEINSEIGYGLKLKLYKHWVDNYKATGGSDFHSSKRRSFYTLFDSYRDILHHNKKPFYLKGQEEDSSIMDAYIMHSLNHIFRTRALVLKNNAKVAKHQESPNVEVMNSDEFLDHGFTRPKILILLPMSNIAFRVVKRLIQLTPSTDKVNVENSDRFSVDFGARRGEVGEVMDEFKYSKSKKSSKPSDHKALFDGNIDDHFMIGIKFNRRSIKLYSDFYSSDIIVASPLGLITKIGDAEADKEKDVDYLSSIEVLIIDHADVITMQNWSHMNSIIEQMNRIPSKQHGTDIMRIRPWYLDGQSKFYRQTIILGYYLNPDINSLFNHHCLNYCGKVKMACNYKGVLPQVLLQVRQVYERFEPESVENVDDARLAYFSKKVFPRIKDSSAGGIMIFISSYFEFVRVRNFLKSQGASFCLLDEYQDNRDVSRSRVRFFQGTRKIMLYTERALFYKRYKIRGIKNLIIYSLPERKEFYPEIVNMIEESDSMTATVLFCSFDMLRLERIVGSIHAKKMVKLKEGAYTFS